MLHAVSFLSHTLIFLTALLLTYFPTDFDLVAGGSLLLTPNHISVTILVLYYDIWTFWTFLLFSSYLSLTPLYQSLQMIHRFYILSPSDLHF